MKFGSFYGHPLPEEQRKESYASGSWLLVPLTDPAQR